MKGKKLEKIGTIGKNVGVKVGRKVKKGTGKLKKGVKRELRKRHSRSLTLSQKIWDNFYIALFKAQALDDIRGIATVKLGLFGLILTSLIMVFPTDKISMIPAVIVSNFVAVTIGLFVTQVLTFGAMKLLKVQTGFKEFFSTVNMAILMSLVVVTIPLALISFAVFSTMFQNQSVLTLIFSIIPFYNYLVYGWATESVADLKGFRSILVALCALFFILLFNILLPFFVV